MTSEQELMKDIWVLRDRYSRTKKPQYPIIKPKNIRQEQLEGFICFVIVDSLEHPNSSPKSTIKRLYKRDKLRRKELKSIGER